MKSLVTQTSKPTSGPSLAILHMITYAEMFAFLQCLSQLRFMTQGKLHTTSLKTHAFHFFYIKPKLVFGVESGLEYGKVLSGWLRYGRVRAMIAHEL